MEGQIWDEGTNKECEGQEGTPSHPLFYLISSLSHSFLIFYTVILPCSSLFSLNPTLHPSFPFSLSHLFPFPFPLVGECGRERREEGRTWKVRREAGREGGRSSRQTGKTGKRGGRRQVWQQQQQQGTTTTITKSTTTTTMVWGERDRNQRCARTVSNKQVPWRVTAWQKNKQTGNGRMN